MTTAVLPISITQARSREPIPETRGYHLAQARAMTPELVRDEMAWAARAGFNLVVFPVYINGYTAFPSEAAREIGFDRVSPLYRKWDPLAAALEAAHAEGLKLWGFVRPYNFHPRYALRPHRLLKRFPDWAMQIHPSCWDSPLRRREAYVACPVNLDYRRYLGNMLAELVTAYPVDGVVFNYTGYGLRDGGLRESPFCYCGACQARYGESHGEPMVEAAERPAGLAAVRAWQRKVSGETLEYLRHRLMKSRRTLRLVCRAQPQWRGNYNEAGPFFHEPYCIDWNPLLGSGTVEELIIDHDDENSAEVFSSRLVTDLSELHHESLLLPSMRLTEPDDLAAPLGAIRKYALSGFMVELARPMTLEDADLIREDFLNEPALLPESAPLQGVAYLLARVQAAHRDNPLISDFMRDFLRLVERAVRHGPDFATLELIFDNLRGLQSAIRRRRLGDYPIPPATLRDIALARRLVRLACLDVRS